MTLRLRRLAVCIVALAGLSGGTVAVFAHSDAAAGRPTVQADPVQPNNTIWG